jgi:hypothetical protein
VTAHAHPLEGKIIREMTITATVNIIISTKGGTLFRISRDSGRKPPSEGINIYRLILSPISWTLV